MSFSLFPQYRQLTDLLQRSLDRGRLAHGYLFTGGSLEEPEKMARTLAKTLNCQRPPATGASGLALDCCNACLHCRKIDADNHPDVQWVRPESKSRVITVDQMREVMRTIHLKPMEAAFKIAVIAGADRLNTQAANAFLKTLEEPPTQSVIILLTSEPQQMLETILSRCLRLNFSGGDVQPQGEPEDWLKALSSAASENMKSLLHRYRLLGILQSELLRRREGIEKALTARSPLEKYPDAETATKEKWEEELAASVEAEYRRQRVELFRVLMVWFRDIWLQTMDLAVNRHGFPSLADATAKVASRLAPEAAQENLDILEQTRRLLETNVQEVLALEVGVLKLKL
jgi:DNA polymerase III subunit delta'